jgi:hypothetical protein
MKKNSATLKLYFSSGQRPELLKTIFECPKMSTTIVGQRTLGLLPQGTVSFKWTQCTRALSMFFLKARIQIPKHGESTPLLEGYALSPAASLGARLWKRDKAWIHDLFGTDKDGKPVLRSLAIGINVRQKIKAPIQLFLRTSFLPVEGIQIFQDDKEITNSPKQLRLLYESLLEAWVPMECVHKAQKSPLLAESQLAA